MRDNVNLTLERLKHIDFFANVGSEESLVVAEYEFRFVDSWSEAVSVRGSDLASDAFSEATGRLTRKLSSEFRKQYRQWNAIVGSYRASLETELFPRLDKLIDSIPELQAITHGPELMKDFTRWDLIHYATEQAYSELVPSQFYSSIIDVYAAGRFPCNWNEEWPNGLLWIF